MMARDQCHMVVRQQPQRAQVVQENNPKNRKPIDPPPIIELKYNDHDDPTNAQWLVSPRTFMMVTLISTKEGESESSPGKYLIGQTVSSLHRLKDINNKDGGFFVFGDISARKLGQFRLRFSLFDTNKESEQVVFLGAVDSDVFSVLPQRDFGSMSESTHLTRTFSDQGVKLRVRKDNRAISSLGTKRPYQHSPPENNSPGVQTGGMYGGAVQDYGSVQSPPGNKRHRSASEYDNSTYSGLMYESSMPPSTSGIPSGTRYDPQRLNYTSPMTSMLGRSQTMGVATPSQYPSMYQPSTPVVSTQQQAPYSAYADHQPSLPALGSGSTPRYPSGGYSYQTPGQYPTYASTDQSYGDPYGSASSHIGTIGMGSSADSGYGFAQASSGYPEQSEGQRGYGSYAA